uniref:HTH myb-type domain-containing protein n=1 Tax=Aegilops tauschii subsp. strangulata TaxID=200361 RepID=A0A453GZB7_AEGTS
DAKRFIFCSLDQKFLDETDAVLFNCPNSLEAKPTAVKQRMEAMGVTGLTIWNIKSHLQRYREKCNLGAEPPRDVLGTASPSKAGDNVYGSLM